MSPSRINVQVKLLSIPQDGEAFKPGKVANGTKGSEQGNSQHLNKTEYGKNGSGSTASELLLKAKSLASCIKPYWALLLYPSDLHYIGRTFAMTVVTSSVIYETVQKLTKDWDGDYGALVRDSGVYLVEGPQKGTVGLDKEF